MSDPVPPVPRLDAFSLRLAAANALIRRRRTIKPAAMSVKRVEHEHLAAILENANWAPTHGLTEPWRFVVFTDEARGSLASKLQALYRDTTPAAEVREDKLAKLGETPLLAPVVIAVGLHRQVSAQIPELEEIEAVACAVQNMHLTASALGMAAFWSTPPVTYTREMADWLGWTGAGDRCLGLFYLGWPADETWPDSPRRPMADKVVWRNSAE